MPNTSNNKEFKLVLKAGIKKQKLKIVIYFKSSLTWRKKN